MNFIFLPDTRKPDIFQGDAFFKGLFDRNRVRRAEVFRFNQMILGLFLLLFAVRMGSLVAMVFQETGFWAVAFYAEGIHLPESEYRASTIQSRLVVYITIRKHGDVEVGGEPLPSTNQADFLKKFLRWNPRSFPVLIVDRDTPMEHVTPVIQQIREAGFAKIKFATGRPSTGQQSSYSYSNGQL